MLAIRIIPTLLVRNGQLVKGKQFQSWRTVGVPAQAMRIYAARGIDELAYLDIGATLQNQKPDFETIRSITEGLFCPIAIGGGIKTLNDIEQLLRNGADKVIIGTNIEIIRSAAKRFGSQAICCAIDYRVLSDKTRTIIKCGTQAIGPNPLQIAMRVEQWGAGEILLTSIDRDGMMCGYDLKTIERVATGVRIPVVASGGCGTYEHMAEAIQAGASAVAASSMFLFTDNTPRGAAEYLSKKGIQVRL